MITLQAETNLQIFSLGLAWLGCRVRETDAGYGPTETDYRRLLPIPISSAGDRCTTVHSTADRTVNITLGGLIFRDVINGRGIVTMPAANQTRLQLICRILLDCVHWIYCNIDEMCKSFS